jgi:hypothetical protein
VGGGGKNLLPPYDTINMEKELQQTLGGGNEGIRGGTFDFSYIQRWYFRTCSLGMSTSQATHFPNPLSLPTNLRILTIKVTSGATVSYGNEVRNILMKLSADPTISRVCVVSSKHTFSSTTFTKSMDMESRSQNKLVKKTGKLHHIYLKLIQIFPNSSSEIWQFIF